MDHVDQNPPANTLGKGVSEADIKDAISQSGYPLQTAVTTSLLDDFAVHEEWSFKDRDSGKLRALDLRADKRLFDLRELTGQPRLRPTLTLLMECKRSALPYVFFLSPSVPWLPNFPRIAGLKHNQVTVTTDDSPSTWTYNIPHALGLDRQPFVQDPLYCTTFSSAVRQGSDIRLSGSNAYNSIILPLSKSLLHFQEVVKPPDTAVYFDCYATVAVGLLDAPMVMVPSATNAAEPFLAPWVRVVRHEFKHGKHWLNRSRFLIFDIVHESFLDEYLETHLLPFANTFSDRALDNQLPLATGRAFVQGMGNRSDVTLPDDLEERSAKKRLIRIREVARNILPWL